jgi:beta-lactamase superfamily II metal-dependent hydrolase
LVSTQASRKRFVHLWLFAAFCWAARLGAQGLTIRFIDVGQGDAALIQSPAGRNVLVDAGPSPSRVADWLRRAKVDTIHLAIASHNHADHIAGMPQVLDRLVVRNYMENGMVATTRTYARIVTLLEERAVPVLKATPRRIDLGGGASIRIFHSTPDPKSQNDASIGFELDYGSFHAIFSGDAEGKQRATWLREDSLVHAQVLKVAHHGSINGTDTAWLSRLHPCAAVISVGAKNSFGHPSPVVSRLLDSSAVVTYRTDRAGDVTVVADSTGSFAVWSRARQRPTKFDRSCRQSH